MKAWVLHNINDIRYEETDMPRLADNEALVEVKAAGICGSDIPRIYQTGAHRHPLIPGHEFSGKVVQAGKAVSREWTGKRVGVFPLIPCKTCNECRCQRYELCRSYSYLGSRTNGGFAEYAAVPEWNLIELPGNVSYEQAAMLEPMAVAVHAMRSVLPDDGDKSRTIAVCGFGTIGILLAMFLKEAGYGNIYVIGNKPFQKEISEKLGINQSHFFDNKDSGAHTWLKARTNGIGADVFFECVGKSETVADAIMGTAPEGTVQLVGNPATDMVLKKDIYWKILRCQMAVKGSWNSSFRHSIDDDWHYVLERLCKGVVSPEQCITHFFPLDCLEQGLLIMRDKTQEHGKIMVMIT